MSDAHKLVRHPPPHPSESLPGYVLRLCEANGYESPRAIFQVANMNQTETSWSNFDCTKLATAANCPVSDLERLAFRHKDDAQNTKYLLGQTIGSANLNLTAARVCPECVAEKGFIEAHWHIDLMIACPIHVQSAVWYCPGCNSRIPWIRKGLLTCSCGRRLDNRDRSSFQAADVWLLDLMRCKAIGDRLSRLNEDCVPEALLTAMSLSELLSFVRFLGRMRREVSRSPKDHYAKDLLWAAARVLTEWPRNFQMLLGDICPAAAEFKSPDSDDPDLFRSVREAIHGAYVKSRTLSSASCNTLPKVASKGHLRANVLPRAQGVSRVEGGHLLAHGCL